MSPNSAILRPLGCETRDAWSTLRWLFKEDSSRGFVIEHSVRESDRHLFVEAERGDHVLVAVLLLAMQRQLDIAVEGRVSPRLLDGLETLQEIWHRWRPGRYKPIQVRAEEESEAMAIGSDRPALFAFSGGVDATFSLFRHLKGQAGRKNRRPGAALLVQGMDIPLGQDDQYAGAAERAQAALDGSGIPLLLMRTNTRRLGMDWEDTHALQLAACFLSLQGHFAFALQGSAEPYESLVMPWGSTPLTVPLSSTETMKVEEDGCHFDRTEKVAWLAANTGVVDQLRVCWAGERKDRNCGRCEKCVRTMLNFWAVGLPAGDAFPVKLTEALVSAIKVKNVVQLRELESLRRHALKHHEASDPILRALEKVIVRKKIESEIVSKLALGKFLEMNGT